jgi:two-component system response regulator DesR
MIRLMIVDDDPDTRRMLALRLAQEADFEVVGCIDRTEELILAGVASRPDVVLLDLGMPGRSPVDTMRELNAKLPDCRVLIWSGRSDEELVAAAWRAGAWGFLGKKYEVGELLTAVRRVAAGQMVFGRAP